MGTGVSERRERVPLHDGLFVQPLEVLLELRDGGHVTVTAVPFFLLVILHPRVGFSVNDVHLAEGKFAGVEVHHRLLKRRDRHQHRDDGNTLPDTPKGFEERQVNARQMERRREERHALHVVLHDIPRNPLRLITRVLGATLRVDTC